MRKFRLTSIEEWGVVIVVKRNWKCGEEWKAVFPAGERLGDLVDPSGDTDSAERKRQVLLAILAGIGKWKPCYVKGRKAFYYLDIK